MIYKEPKLFGKDEDGEYLGRIEEICTGRPLNLFGKTLLKESGDELYISNRHHNLWAFSLLNGYRQIGIFEVAYPHNFREGQNVIVTKKNNKIVSVVAE